jgi:hypothetical protein
VTESEAWLTRLAGRWFATFLVVYGCAAMLSPGNRLPATAVLDIAELLKIPAHVLFGLTMIVPGIVILIPQLTRIGLFLAIGSLGTYEVGTIWATVRGQGTYTGPVIVFFVLAFAAGLLWVVDEKDGRHE